MATIYKYLSYAETALAAYGVELISGGNNTSKYVDQGMDGKEAERFDKNWTLLSQSPNSINGFSAVLLQNRTSGEKVLAIRGSETVADYVTDIINIGALGSVAAIPQYQSLDAYYAQLVSSGLLGNTEQIVVTGHSLGGFLTQAFVARHDAVVSAAYTFNAPGMRGVLGQALEFIGITDASVPNSKIINVHAADGVSATAGLGQMLGTVQQVRIEAGTANPLYYHSIETLTDTLSVYQAYAGLQPSLTVDQIANLFVGAGVGSRKLESALDVLRTALLGPGQPSTTTGDKESLFDHPYALTDSQAYTDLAGQLTLTPASLDLRGLGGNDFISGEQYDDRLDGGDGDDLIWGGAGSDVILGGAGNDIIVSNMAATYLDDAAEIPTPAGYTRGADTVISYEGDPAYAQGRWWVERSDSGDSLRIQRAYMKNPDGGDGCIHYSKYSCQRLSIKRCRPFSFKRVWAADHSHVHESPAS